MSDFNLGTVTAYGYAKDKGYTGTENEFAALMASYADVAEQAAESATQAAASATTATTKASEAAQSATSAASSKTAAETAQGSAETAATTATTKAGEASTSAATASSKASEATTAAATATNKATEATTAATTATTKAGEASTSATNAAASATRAQEILDSIPADYSQLSDDVEDLKDGLSDVRQSTDLKTLSYETTPQLIADYVFRMSSHDFTTGFGNRFANTGIIPLPSEIYSMELIGANVGSNAQVANFAFFDESKQYIDDSATYKTYTTVPEGAYYVAIGNFNANSTHTGVKCIYYRYKVLQTMTENAEMIEALESVPTSVHPTITAGGWLQDGVWVSNGNQQLGASDYIEIPSSAYAVTCNIGVFSASTTIAFYDVNKTYLSGYAEKSHAIVSNAKYMRLCNYATTSRVPHDDVTYLFLELERIVTIENEVKELDSRVDLNVPNWTGKKWCVIGDSITEVNFRTTKNYWAYIEDLTDITIANQGIGGTGYKQYQPFYQRIEASTFPEDCDLITMFGGVNDIVGWSNSYNIGTYTDTTDDTICGCVNHAIDALEEKYPIFCPLGIISPLPCAVNTEYAAFEDATYPNQYPLLPDCRMETFVSELKKICAYRGYPFIDLYHQSGLRPWDTVIRKQLFAPPVGYGYQNGDGLHPNAEGHSLFYRKIFEFIKGIIIE